MCKCICSFFAYSPAADAVFRDIRTELGINSGLIQPVVTRWASYLDCLCSILKNKPALQRTALLPNVAPHLDRILRDSILSESTFEEIADVLDLLSPIKALIRVAESDECNASRMFRSFSEFTFGVQQSQLPWATEATRCISRRWEGLHHPVLSLACLLDPSDQGKALSGLSCSLDRDVEEAVERLVPKLKLRMFSSVSSYSTRHDRVFLNLVRFGQLPIRIS